MITELTGMDISNASLLDEATSVAEAMCMAFSIHNQKRKRFFISETMFRQTIGVVETRAEAAGIELTVGKMEDFPWE